MPREKEDNENTAERGQEESETLDFSKQTWFLPNDVV
jgi:hypothetical protein